MMIFLACDIEIWVPKYFPYRLCLHLDNSRGRLFCGLWVRSSYMYMREEGKGKRENNRPKISFTFLGLCVVIRSLKFVIVALVNTIGRLSCLLSVNIKNRWNISYNSSNWENEQEISNIGILETRRKGKKKLKTFHIFERREKFLCSTRSVVVENEEWKYIPYHESHSLERIRGNSTLMRILHHKNAEMKWNEIIKKMKY